MERPHTHLLPVGRVGSLSLAVESLGSGCSYVWQTVSVSLQSLSLTVSVWLSLCLSAESVSGCLSSWLSLWLFLCLAVSLSLCPLLCLSVCLSLCPSCLSVCVAERQSGRAAPLRPFSLHGPWTRHGKSAERGTESVIMSGTTEDISAGSIILINGTHTLLKCM